MAFHKTLGYYFEDSTTLKEHYFEDTTVSGYLRVVIEMHLFAKVNGCLSNLFCMYAWVFLVVN